MINSKLYMGNAPIKQLNDKVDGEYVIIKGDEYYKISNYDAMRPFFMTLVSSSDLWLFISSNGGLSAGRKSPETALFPYYTDDKITDSAEITGSKTIFKITKGDKTFLWEPFSNRNQGAYSIQRNIYKNRVGNKLIFEECNNDLEVVFKYSWTFSDRFGFIKEATLVNESNERLDIDFLDGIQNILPYGVNSALQNSKSTLVDAYKKNELYDNGVGIFSLSAMIVDRAEPSEALKATVVWSVGVEVKNYLLSSNQLSKYRTGFAIDNESDIRAERGAYFINARIELKAKATSNWYIVSDINQSMVGISSLKKLLDNSDALISAIQKDVRVGEDELRKLVGMCDGIQLSNDKMSSGRHFSNVLYNIMRGGLFNDLYSINLSELAQYLQLANTEHFDKNIQFIGELQQDIDYKELIDAAELKDDIDLERLCYEYLPLSFSRRHGDPSRPWNAFLINKSDKKGYEGNWRDIFQNWEALAYSFPQFVEGMIIKFLNASTIDGYNPYRITSKGIDWEVIEEDDPWSYIGYWGDHQIIYLLRLMEISESHHPNKLVSLLTKNIGVYANVPYRIKRYKDIINSPSDTIDFDYDLNNDIEKRYHQLGSDGKLISSKGKLLRANVAEKLLVTTLTKLYNFIPEAGIWLNTQRPEWNDANNALVGNGVSMVTLYYMRRFVNFSIGLFKRFDKNLKIDFNQPVIELLVAIRELFEENKNYLNSSISDVNRKKIVDELGHAGEVYRTKAYAGFNNELVSVHPLDIISFLELSLQYIDHSIDSNKREDGLFHSYNLIEFNEDKASINRLYPMLEGQVAVLTANYLNASQAKEVLNSLKKSAMYREDQYSYMLYPNKELPHFVNRNTISSKFIQNSKLANALMDRSDSSIFEKSIDGEYHFNGNFNNVNNLIEELDKLNNPEIQDLVANEKNEFINAFEEVFQHKYFTGRSGTFYGYEGLGSIYWHMVSKLLLATQESIYLAVENIADKSVVGNLVEHYYEIRAGIGINKSPEVYGAFPTDAYSHTPGNTGVRQPGMTGQVKEDIINRWAELGVVVEDGCIHFNPHFLKLEEFVDEKSEFEFYDANGNRQLIPVDKGSIAFTYCGIAIVYLLSDNEGIEVEYIDGTLDHIKGQVLPLNISQKIFNRKSEIQKIIYLHKHI